MNKFRLGWATVGLVSVTIVAAAGTFASGEVIRVISPMSAENEEGNSFVRPNLIPFRIQHLFPASDFADLPDSNRLIVAFNFRADRTQTEPIDWGRSDEQIWMSTTDKDILTDVFDDNHGPDKIMVHDGAITYPLLATGPASGPREVADGTRLQTPFVYDPSQGNLLVERLSFANNPSRQVNIDVQRTSLARILINDVDPSSTTGSLLTDVAVIQFEFRRPFSKRATPTKTWISTNWTLSTCRLPRSTLRANPPHGAKGTGMARRVVHLAILPPEMGSSISLTWSLHSAPAPI